MSDKGHLKPLSSVGSWFEMDEQGFILNKCTPKNIDTPWIELIEDIKDVFVGRFGEGLHGLYVRGSIARGEAIPYISDLDAFSVHTTVLDQDDEIWIRTLEIVLQDNYPQISAFDIRLFSYDDVLASPHMEGLRFIIKTQSLCIYGEDLAQILPKYKPGISGIMSAWGLNYAINRANEIFLAQEMSPSEIQTSCRWMMSKLVRSGFELVMEHDGRYTRDLVLASEAFSEYYPKKKMDMEHALRLAIYPTTDKKEVLQIMASLGTWLSKQFEGKLPVKDLEPDR